MSQLRIGLALSGGGSRAIAFHLGCLRALHDRGILEKVDVLSGVSGGSVIAALYAYEDDSFDAFERRVESVLSRGMVMGIAREVFLSPEALKIVAANLTSGLVALSTRVLQFATGLFGLWGIGRLPLLKRIGRIEAPLRRFASRTTALERYLARAHFGQKTVSDVGRANLKVVINAAELRTESAFRFGSVESGCWRFGRLLTPPRVATAVAASAAFPAFLPALDCRLSFHKEGGSEDHRVLITDGGVYDNLGISCMLPGRSGEFSTNAHPVDFIIACDAGQGIPAGSRLPYFWGARMLATILTIHRRTQTMSQDLLHRLAASGEIKGFVMPYLGMQDSRVPARPADLVSRQETADYPTNFNSMALEDIGFLSRRGEQLTSVLLDTYAPDL